MPQAPTVAAANTSPAQLTSASHREIRATGKIRAVRHFVVQAPRIIGQNARLTLVSIVKSGAVVKAGDVLAEFDVTAQLDQARDAQAKYDDLAHQVSQKQAENYSNAATRASELQQARADLAKAQIQLKRGPVLPDIERQQSLVRAEDARLHLDSLQQSHVAREKADAAALRILELKRDRQKVALDRATLNLEKLLVKAPLAGMVALDYIWRSGSMGPPQEGDQLYPGQALLRIFDPTTMEVHAYIEEPDGAVLDEGATATVLLDAYPDLEFPARLQSASPVAAAAIGSPIKRFAARFLIEKTDPRLLPDLAAAVVVQVPAKGPNP